MFKSVSPEQRNAWKERIQQQQSSGQSITQWCKEHGVTSGQFHYWKKEFCRSLQRSEFLELTPPKKEGIRVEYHGVSIQLEGNFDPAVFKQCLAVLREFLC